MDRNDFSVTLTLRHGMQFAAQFDEPGLPLLVMDEPPPLGEGSGPNAARVLAAAVGNCLSASLLFCLKKQRLTLNGMRARVKGTLERNEHGRLRIAGLQAQLHPDLAPDDRARMARCLELFEDFCIVTQSVRRGITVDVSVGTGVPAG